MFMFLFVRHHAKQERREWSDLVPRIARSISHFVRQCPNALLMVTVGGLTCHYQNAKRVGARNNWHFVRTYTHLSNIKWHNLEHHSPDRCRPPTTRAIAVIEFTRLPSGIGHYSRFGDWPVC
jgi:hypothetical protein